VTSDREPSGSQAQGASRGPQSSSRAQSAPEGARSSSRAHSAPEGARSSAQEPEGAGFDKAPSVRVVKHSIVIAGHRTSVSLEDAFWRALKEIAAKDGVSLAALVAKVDAGRAEANLSSALRVFVLERAVATAKEKQEAPYAAALDG
jgi:predicted DNA-binding ribbon-helix-helix protein